MAVDQERKRILFVDDEPMVLEGLRDLLRPRRREWDMVFAGGGQAALDELSKTTFDVVVSDIRMPDVDGRTVLEHVQHHHPRSVRILLSGEADPEIALKAVPFAHQFLAKPCDPDRLRSVINRACDLQRLLTDQALLAVFGKIKTLPAVPRLFAKVREALTTAKTSARDVASIIERDSAMSAKVLQLVNSSFFGLGRKVSQIQEAVAMIGFEMLKNLVLTAEVFAPFDSRSQIPNLSIDKLQDHMVLVGSIASKLFDDAKLAEEAFTAGMLHDFGLLVMASVMPEKVTRVMTLAGKMGEALRAMELDVLEATHAEVGAYILGLWGLPYPVVEAVANHHDPGRVQEPRFDILTAVHVADALAHEFSPETFGPIAEAETAIDEAYLESIGAAGQLPAWRAQAEAIVAATRKGS